MMSGGVCSDERAVKTISTQMMSTTEETKVRLRDSGEIHQHNV